VLKAAELDTRNEARDVAKAQALWAMDAANVDWITNFFGLPKRDDGSGALYRDQLDPGAPSLGSIPAAVLKARFSPEVTELRAIRKRLEAIIPGAQAA
jgi:hypothetical protein